MQVWYKRFGYTSNTRIIHSSKLLTRIGDFNANYDLAKIYNNFEAFESKILLVTMPICYLDNRLYLKLQKQLTSDQILTKYANHILKINKFVLFVNKSL